MDDEYLKTFSHNKNGFVKAFFVHSNLTTQNARHLGIFSQFVNKEKQQDY